MKYNPEIHHRRSIRLRGYDYSQEGAYFITICTQNRRYFFGDIKNGEMLLNEFGEIAYREWEKLPERWPHLELGAFQIMPNHMHGIVVIRNTPVRATLAVAQLAGTPIPDKNDLPITSEATVELRATARVAPTVATTVATTEKRETQIQWATKPTIGQITGAYKSRVLTECLKWITANKPEMRLGKLWQRNLWEHVIRNIEAFDKISDYIINNPKKWEADKLFSEEN